MTLIELMCVLVVVAMMSAYALPLYRESIARGRRQSVIAAVQAAALEVEARLSDDDASQADASRTSDKHNVSGNSRGNGLLTPEVLIAGQRAYRLVLHGGPTGTAGKDTSLQYVIEAVPVKGGLMQDDRCGTFVLDSKGKRYNRRASDGHPSDVESRHETAAGPCWAGGG